MSEELTKALRQMSDSELQELSDACHGVMFTVRLRLEVDGTRLIHYESFKDFWGDAPNLTNLFAGDLVESCEIYCGDTRIGGLGRMRLVGLRDLLISNSARILRAYCGAPTIEIQTQKGKQ